MRNNVDDHIVCDHIDSEKIARIRSSFEVARAGVQQSRIASRTLHLSISLSILLSFYLSLTLHLFLSSFPSFMPFSHLLCSLGRSVCVDLCRHQRASCFNADACHTRSQPCVSARPNPNLLPLVLRYDREILSAETMRTCLTMLPSLLRPDQRFSGFTPHPSAQVLEANSHARARWTLISNFPDQCTTIMKCRPKASCAADHLALQTRFWARPFLAIRPQAALAALTCRSSPCSPSPPAWDGPRRFIYIYIYIYLYIYIERERESE